MSDLGSRHVEVAVTVIRRGAALWAPYNPKWAAFTLPMTKRRGQENRDNSEIEESEPWPEAAKRNVVEWFECSFDQNFDCLMDIDGYRQSDRDLFVKIYHFRVFALAADNRLTLRPDVVGEWLARSDFQEFHRRPISPTARFLVEELQKQGKLWPE